MLERDIEYYEDSVQFAQHVANVLQSSILSSLENKQDAPTYLGLSGGSTPRAIYQCLSNCECDWKRVQAIVGDERIVDSSSEDFNGNMIASSLIKNKANACEFIAFDMEKHELSHYQKRIRSITPLDICVLGMGLDCHTASIFHDAPNLNELLHDTDNQLLIRTSSPRMPQQRVSLTMPVLQKSREIHLVIQGKGKKKALDNALAAKSMTEFPILNIVSLPQTTIHYCL